MFALIIVSAGVLYLLSQQKAKAYREQGLTARRSNYFERKGLVSEELSAVGRSAARWDPDTFTDALRSPWNFRGPHWQAK
jgi:hypothetical protein